MSVKHLYLVAVVAVLGCAPAVTPHPSAAPRRTNVLTSEEIFLAEADAANVYDALSRLRPIWLTARGPTSFYTPGTDLPVAFIDGQAFNDLNFLRNIAASHVTEIRYYPPDQAGATFGVKAGTGGVIEVKLKQATPRPRP